MKIVLLASDSSALGELTKLKSEAKESFAGTCKEVERGETMVPKPPEDDHAGHDHRMLSAGGGCFELHLKEDDDHAGHAHRSLEALSSVGGADNRRRLAGDATFKIDTSQVAHLAIFTDLAVTEFAPTQHYLLDADGHGVYAKSQINAPPSKPWGVAIGAGFLVGLVTLIGVMFLIPVFRTAAEKHPNVFGAISSSFAAGALLGAAFFLLLFEATHLVPGGASEGASAAMWGTAIMLGFITSSLLDLGVTACCAPKTSPGGEGGAAAAAGETSTDAAEKGNAAEKGVAATGTIAVEVAGLAAARRTRVIMGILVGDFLHNLCDGIFIGTAFLACTPAVGWSVSVATIYHELAQEVGDFFVLTNKDQGALSPLKALSLNFVSGLSVVVGIVIVLAQSTVDGRAVGLLLAFGGGVYVQLGASECMPRAYALSTTTTLRLCNIIAFVVGATAIALVLIDHRHCSAGGSMAAADAHAGHDHSLG